MTHTSGSRPRVSILILNFNKSQLTINCVESIRAYTDYPDLEIIVLDNGSNIDEQQLLSAAGDIKLIQLHKNRYFGEGNNIGFGAMAGEYVVFMNNDVTVNAGWLPPLLYAFENHPDCGVAGPKFLYPDGRLQEAGALVDETGEPIRIGLLQDPNDPVFNNTRTVDYVSAATLMVKREIFSRTLGFSQIYEPAYYEDADLCLKIGQLGLKTYYVPQSSVVHHENATTADPRNNFNLHELIEINRRKFVERWADYLVAGEHRALACHPTGRSAIDNGVAHNPSGLALLYTDLDLVCDESSHYLLSLAELLLHRGFQTQIITNVPYSSLRLSQLARFFGLELDHLLVGAETAAATAERAAVCIVACQSVPAWIAQGRQGSSLIQLHMDAAALVKGQPSSESDCAGIHVTQVAPAVPDSGSEAVDLILRIPPGVAYPTSIGQATPNGKNILSRGMFAADERCAGQHLLISAFRQLHANGYVGELHFLGSIYPEAEHRRYFLDCQQLAQGLPIYFHIDPTESRQREVVARCALYWHGRGVQAADAPSRGRSDLLGTHLLQAMAAGLMPFAVNSGAAAAVIRNGTDGFLYEHEAELATLTERFLALDPEAITPYQAQAQKRAATFSKERFYKAWSALCPA